MRTFVYDWGMEAIPEMPRKLKDVQPKPLREIRQGKYWSVTTLAMLAGVDRTTIWRIENGKGKYLPHPHTRKAIADALGVHPSEVAEFEVKSTGSPERADVSSAK
jgi:transcriptional regulator with XRE-family HTH domain